MSGDEEHQPCVAVVAIKLLPYWPSNPNIWFTQVEVQFATQGITNQPNMFEYVVTLLSPDITTEICNLILSPSIENLYTNLKEKSMAASQ